MMLSSSTTTTRALGCSSCRRAGGKTKPPMPMAARRLPGRRPTTRCSSAIGDPTGVAQVAIVIAATAAALSAPGPAPVKEQEGADKKMKGLMEEPEDAAAAVAPADAFAATAEDETPIAAVVTIAAAIEQQQEEALEPKQQAPELREDPSNPLITIAVFGVGGGGCNAVRNMMERGNSSADNNSTTTTTKYFAVNTDAQALDSHPAPPKNRLQIGATALRGLGAGGNPDVGRSAALESAETLRTAVAEARADLVFVTAGMGGGTGTGAAPVVAAAAREQGALTVGVVTFPFAFEGRRRQKQALEGIAALRAPGSGVDTLIVVANDRLLEVVEGGEENDDDNATNNQKQLTMLDAFAKADDVLRLGVEGITELLSTAGLINVDFADVRSVMQANNKGGANQPATLGVLGTGAAKGRDRAVRAALSAASAPLLMCSPISSASGVVFTVQGGPSLTLQEVAAAADAVASLVGPDANVIFGAVVDDQAVKGSKEDEQVRVTLIATGFPYELEEAALQFGVGGGSSRAGSRAGAWVGGGVGASPVQSQQAQPRHQRYDY
jgi:cell division protein FtsZ